MGDVAGEHSSGNVALVDAVMRKNVKLTMGGILDRSPVIRTLADAGKVKIVGVIYDVATGKVELL